LALSFCSFYFNYYKYIHVLLQESIVLGEEIRKGKLDVAELGCYLLGFDFELDDCDSGELIEYLQL
jgi:hypothetical protein